MLDVNYVIETQVYVVADNLTKIFYSAYFVKSFTFV